VACPAFRQRGLGNNRTLRGCGCGCGCGKGQGRLIGGGFLKDAEGRCEELLFPTSDPIPKISEADIISDTDTEVSRHNPRIGTSRPHPHPDDDDDDDDDGFIGFHDIKEPHRHMRDFLLAEENDMRVIAVRTVNDGGESGEKKARDLVRVFDCVVGVLEGLVRDPGSDVGVC